MKLTSHSRAHSLITAHGRFKEEDSVGVFCCGPMGNDLRLNCVKYSQLARAATAEGKAAPPMEAGAENQEAEQDIRFQLHAEVF